VLELEASHRSAQANDHTRAETHLLKAIKTARSSLADVRNYMFGLRTPWPNQEGLIPALERLITDFHQRNALPIRMKQFGTVTELPPLIEESLLRITQEALTNVSKHAQAKNVEVMLTFEPKEVTIQIIDDGQGFDVEPTLRQARDKGSLGVVGMRERLTGLGGQLELTSAPNQGTRVLVRIPVNEPSTQTA
jgi:signal transduction histidine kinase